MDNGVYLLCMHNTQFQQRRVAANYRQDVVEVMCRTAGKLPLRFQALNLTRTSSSARSSAISIQVSRVREWVASSSGGTRHHTIRARLT